MNSSSTSSFFILNAVVGFFSLLIRILEKIDLYATYKTYVFHGASSIWHGFTGSNSGNITNKSLVGTLLLVLAFYLFYQYFFSKGSFSRTLLHVCLVLLLALGYFGTVAGTSGGLYLLDTVNNVSKDVTKKLQVLRWTMPKTSQLKLENRCRIATLQKRPIKPMSLSIPAKKMENTRIAKTGKKKPLTTVRSWN